MICENCFAPIGDLVPLKDKAKREEWLKKGQTVLEPENGVFGPVGFLCHRCHDVSPEERVRIHEEAVVRMLGPKVKTGPKKPWWRFW